MASWLGRYQLWPLFDRQVHGIERSRGARRRPDARSWYLSQGLVHAGKFASHRSRPDGSDPYSLPSGHTASAFATATVLQRHFGWKAGIPAYGFGAYVAASRMSANKHHLSDVVIGAAIGVAAGRTVTVGRAQGAIQPGHDAHAAWRGDHVHEALGLVTLNLKWQVWASCRSALDTSTVRGPACRSGNNACPRIVGAGYPRPIACPVTPPPSRQLHGSTRRRRGERSSSTAPSHATICAIGMRPHARSQHAAGREQSSRSVSSTDPPTRATDAKLQVHDSRATILVGARIRSESFSRGASPATGGPSPCVENPLLSGVERRHGDLLTHNRRPTSKDRQALSSST